MRAARLMQKEVRQPRLARGANQQIGRGVRLSVQAAREECVGDVAAMDSQISNRGGWQRKTGRDGRVTCLSMLESKEGREE